MKKKKDEITIRSSAAEYLTYVASGGDQQDSVEMRYEDENIWLTQRMMATLYDVGLPTINEHIKKIYADSELEETATIRNFRIVQTEGSRQVTRDTKHYSPVSYTHLDVYKRQEQKLGIELVKKTRRLLNLNKSYIHLIKPVLNIRNLILSLILRCV